MAFTRSGVRSPSPPPAGIAQLVEHNLAKVGVAGSSPVSRSERPEAQRHGRTDARPGGRRPALDHPDATRNSASRNWFWLSGG